MVKEL
jgi:hypothetical protein